MASVDLAEIAESDDHAQWIVEHHTGQTMVDGARSRCTYCETWWPCALVELAALAVLRSRQGAADRAIVEAARAYRQSLAHPWNRQRCLDTLIALVDQLDNQKGETDG